jgi:hypothetical protein
MYRNPGLETLLELDGTIVDQGSGYWIKVEAMRVEVSNARPHGIKYSLSLHEPSGARIMGYDNAHALSAKGCRKYSVQAVGFDHRHRHSADKGVRYNFATPYKLLEDFFSDVDRILKERSSNCRRI